MEILVDTGNEVRGFEVLATREGRRVDVVIARGTVEVAEVTRGGQVVRSARFMASRVVAVVEHPASQDARSEPLGHVDRRVRQLADAPLGEHLLVTLEVGGEGPRVAHHHLEQGDALRPGDERPERVALIERDVGAGGAMHVAARHVALEHEHDVVAVVAVRLHDHPGVPLGIEREEAGREVEPLLAHRGGVIAVLLAADLLPREVVEVSNARAAGHESPLMGARSRRGYPSATFRPAS